MIYSSDIKILDEITIGYEVGVSIHRGFGGCQAVVMGDSRALQYCKE
jgi:hypothetical protein